MDNMLSIAEKIPANNSFVILAPDNKPLKSALLNKREKEYVQSMRDNDPDKRFIQIQRMGHWVIVAFIKHDDDVNFKHESCRRAGSRCSDLLNEQKVENVYLSAPDIDFSYLASLAEGIALAGYRFLNYFSKDKADKKSTTLKTLFLVHRKADETKLKKIATGIKYTFLARDLVNEPPSALNAEGFAAMISEKATALNIKAEVFSKSRIEALKMGGLLAVNRGSIDPPTFTVLEYKPKNSTNKAPLVLVGKGIIFDTGGMNLKPGAFMDGMKSDMAGAATMAATILAIAELALPIHVVAMIPATDNRVNGNALLPDDVITMHDGTTVEIKNTDAEGRLILADAISYAKRYDPMLIVDAATLTGAALRAIGHHGIVAMHQNAGEKMELLKKAGEQEYERIAEFPMWREYDEQLKSDIADITNLGGVNGGAITAAKFLAHFTTSPFIHLDIAGPAFIEKRENYIPKGGTGTGVRLLIRFISYLAEN